MKRSQKDNLNEISRASKSRRWDGEEQENLTSLFLPVRNGMVIAENEEAISSLQSRLDTCEIQNQLHQDQLKTHERQLALIRLAQRKETEKIDAQKATVEMLSAHAESAEQKLNTLANSHQAFESKLEANMKQTLSIAQENLEKGLDDLQGNTRQGLEMLAEYTELLELWVQRKEAITKLMAFLGSPEKLEYLKRLMLKEDESHLITSGERAASSVLPLFTHC